MSIEEIARWAERDPIARESEVLVAARGPQLGSREWLEVVAIVRRPGLLDARYREVRVGSVRVPDERTERETLDVLDRIARSIAARLEVRPPACGQANAGREWIERAGPAPVARWTVRWAMTALDERGLERRCEDERVVEARTPVEARAVARRARIEAGVDLEDWAPGSAGREHVIEAEQEWCIGVDARRSAERFAIRADTDAGVPPTETLDAMTLSPREAMFALADAWNVSPLALTAAGAYLRREIAREEADRVLREIATRREQEWKLALRLHQALERDVVDEELERTGRASGIQLIVAMRDVLPELGLAECKDWLGTLGNLGTTVREPGALSRSLAEVRSRRARRGEGWPE